MRWFKVVYSSGGTSLDEFHVFAADEDDAYSITYFDGLVADHGQENLPADLTHVVTPSEGPSVP